MTARTKHAVIAIAWAVMCVSVRAARFLPLFREGGMGRCWVLGVRWLVLRGGSSPRRLDVA